MTDRNLDQAAAELPVSRWWLKEHLTEIPHHRFGRRIFFDDDDLAGIREFCQRKPVPVTPQELRPISRRRRAS